MSGHLRKAALSVTQRRAGSGRHWSQGGRLEAMGDSEGVDAVCRKDTEGKRGRRQGGCPSDLINWTDGGAMAETERPGDGQQTLASVFLSGQ